MHKFVRNLSQMATVGIVFFVSACALTAGVTDSSDKFYSLIKENKTQEAYASTAKAFQNSASLDQFKIFLTATGIDKYASASWPSTSIMNDTGHIEGTITSTTNGSIPVTMDFVKEDGIWKVLNIKPTSTGTTTTTTKAPALPTDAEMSALVTKSMSEFSDAVAAEDFTNLYTNIATVWKSQINADGFKDIFKDFIAQKMDLSFAKTATPTLIGKPALDENNILKIDGSYDTATFSFKYYNENGSWKLVGINVKAK